MKRTIVLLAVVAVIVALGMTGCTAKQFSSVTDWYKSSESNLRTSVHTTTTLIIRTPERAAKVTKALQDVQAKIVAGTLVNASMVEDYTNELLKGAGFTPADLVVLNDLMPQIKEAIVAVFKSEQLTNAKDQLVEIDKVLGWILDITTIVK